MEPGRGNDLDPKEEGGMKPPLPNPIAYHIYTGQKIPTPAMYAYILDGLGIIKLAETPHFRAAIPVSGGSRIAGLGQYPEEGVTLKTPKIPATWLYQVLNHARDCGRIEQMYHFHWLPDGWAVSVPKQDAGSSRVGYHGGHETSIVLDLHSHHVMEPFFSATDNADEQGCRFYAVIGRIYERPEIRLRVGVYGDWLELNLLELFDGPGPFEEA
jgi:proteasome lid subunit RPN8/RPN11